MNKIFKLILSIVICEGAGIIGSFFTSSQIDTWYAELVKPSFNPPNSIFAPVWIILYLLMGISLYLVWDKKFTVKNELLEKDNKKWNRVSKSLWIGMLQKINIISIFTIQLVLNVLWSILFFKFHAPGAAFFEILMLWFAIIYTIINLYRVSRVAAYLFIPYILWVSFAAVLNFAIWQLNM